MSVIRYNSAIVEKDISSSNDIHNVGMYKVEDVADVVKVMIVQEKSMIGV